MAQAERLLRGRQIEIDGTDLATHLPGHIRKVSALDGGLVLVGTETVLGVIHGLVDLTDFRGYCRAAHAVAQTAFHCS